MGKTGSLDLENGNGTANGHAQQANGQAVGSKDGEKNCCAPCSSCLEKVSGVIIGALETGFAKLGLSIGRRPVVYLVACTVVASLCGLGLLEFYEEKDSDKLWTPPDAESLSNKDWIDANYPSTVTRENFIGVTNNILTPAGITALLDIYQSSLTITAGTTTLSDVCITAGSNCLVYSILELWSYNDATIRALTQAQIVSDVNSITVSPMFGQTIDLDVYLGGQTKDGGGQVTAAQAASITWLTNGDDATESLTESWETSLINMARAGHADLSATYIFAGRSWEDEAGNAIQDDIFLLSIGYFLVIIFVFSVLGRFNLMEQRAWLAVGGFVCVGLSILVAIGLASAFQQVYGPVQSVLPFLLLGLGVDDMFVIMGALNNLNPEEQALDIPHRISAVLKHAGVSITVTSFTDFMAFMIGATTIIPALRSFCIYAGLGILALYLLQAMFFTACLTIDLHRIDGERDACLCCLRHPSPPYQSNSCSKREFLPYVFKKFIAKGLSLLPIQIGIVVAALALFGVNLYGFIKLEQYFDPFWFLPSDSYPYLHKVASDTYFPDDGASGYVYCGNLNYWSMQTEFTALDTAMGSSKWIFTGTTDSWFAALTGWLSITSDAAVIAQLDGSRYPLAESNFISLTNQMSTSIYTRTANYLRFNTALDDITASRFPYRHISMNDAGEQIDAMEQTRELVRTAGFSTDQCFAYSFIYSTWETNKVIQEELYRNLALALVCVFLVTLVLIANVRTSCYVFVCVLFTLVDVAGSMHFWNLTIDTVTSTILILAIGLAVDYSAHVGHTFMTITGTNKERMKKTVAEIGPAVFYGGFSTFLAFILLSVSTSYVFKTFFKVNFLVVVYGLFHGLLVLPVILCWLGPEPYPSAGEHQVSPSDESRTKGDVEGVVNHGMVNDVPANGKFTSPREMTTMSNSSNNAPNGVMKSSPPPDYTGPMNTKSGPELTSVQN